VDEINDATFEQEVLRSELPVVVDFWAPWCGPCHAIAPILEQLALENDGRVRFTKLNVDESPVTASRYSVFSLPSVILYADGEPRATVIGARPRSHFEKAFGDYLSPGD
jgi:thioredoxin 1